MEYKEVIWKLLQTIGNVSLSAGKEIQKEGKKIQLTTLANVQHRHTWRELEFYYSLKKDPLTAFFELGKKSILGNNENFKHIIGYLLDTEESSFKVTKQWQNTFSKDLNNDLISQIAAIKNWMQGFIDFIFKQDNKYYFIDWKSNHLGDSLEDYQKENLQLTMLNHNYILQHYIYTIALDNYLKKIPNYTYEENFGGGFYIFLRGLDSEKVDNGIYFFKPPKEKVDFLKKILF